MKSILVPLLRIQRDIYQKPRDLKRFQDYIATMTGGTDDIALPLVAMNPMAKDKAPALVQRLMGLGAEREAERACRDAEARLPLLDDELRAAIVVADDVEGAWTHRERGEASERFESLAGVRRGWATTVFYTSETPTAEDVHRRVLATLYRSFYLRRYGVPKTLRDVLVQEGLTARFAGDLLEPLSEAPRPIFHGRFDETRFSVIFTCMYGDETAQELGYDAIGLPERAGYRIAPAFTLESDLDPVEVLCRPGERAVKENKVARPLPPPRSKQV